MGAYRRMQFQPALVGGQPPWMDPHFHIAGHPSSLGQCELREEIQGEIFKHRLRQRL